MSNGGLNTGDLNQPMGKKDKAKDTLIGINGENVKNDNERKLINLGMLENIIVSKTFYENRYTEIYQWNPY